MVRDEVASAEIARVVIGVAHPTRIATLEAEIARVAAHRDKAEAHRSAADAFFKAKT
jgi:uncharacterized small protein (DUF1192 family)